MNLFLLEHERIGKDLSEVQEKLHVADGQLEDTKQEYEQAKTEYEELESQIEQLDLEIQEKREIITQGQLRRQQFENQVQLLYEQINTAKASDEHLKNRISVLEQQLKERAENENSIQEELKSIQQELTGVSGEEHKENEAADLLRRQIQQTEQEIEAEKSRIISLLNQRATVKARMQRYDTMLEQAQIRKAQISQEALKLKSEEAEQAQVLQQIQKEYTEVTGKIQKLTEESEVLNETLIEVQGKLTDGNHQIDQEQTEYHREASRLESLKNIAERYDGYGNSIRRVMEQKGREPGILGVVADIIKVKKEYEVAVETALGGSIQNIVTDTEETAKRQIEFLKRNKYGRATFLPLSGISGKGGFSSPQALKEAGVIGLASSLVSADARYDELIQFLLGKTLVVDHIDHAIAIARKYKHSLRIVTKEGDLLNPGGSMSGGAFKNSSNLLGRRREIEELEQRVQKRRALLDQLQKQVDQDRVERNRLRDEIVRLKELLQKEYIAQNTAKMKLNEFREKTGSTAQVYQKIRSEGSEIEQQMKEIQESRQQEKDELAISEQEEKNAEQLILERQAILEQKKEEEQKVLETSQNIQLKLSQLTQKEQFIRQDLTRIRVEKMQFMREKDQYEQEIKEASESVQEKETQIRQIQEAASSAETDEKKMLDAMSELSKEREEKSAVHKKFFATREELAERISLLDRETFRLNAQAEKLAEQKDHLVNYMWEEYALTYSSAQELRNETYSNAGSLRKDIAELKSQIKRLGHVNVNAIEDFKELSERHTFLSAQHEDLIKAEEALMKIIEELDNGMRIQFREQFARIQTEFDKAFKQLFGGGRGTLELVEDADILEAGIRIIAQPPGKKLQNMMQLSGGEKSLTAIALLFAIQNLKPSPFCLLDEIEAALDESNVDRYAGYLHKLTKNTQFIIITHRRGTMTAADRLYGITMQEKGVSALVSVNLIENDLDE